MKNNYFYQKLIKGESIKDYSGILNKNTDDGFGRGYGRRMRGFGYHPFMMDDMYYMMKKDYPFLKEMEDLFSSELNALYNGLSASEVSKYQNLLDGDMISSTDIKPNDTKNTNIPIDIIFSDYQHVFGALKTKKKVDNLFEIYQGVNMLYYSIDGVTDEKILDKFLDDLSVQLLRWNLNLNWCDIVDNKPFSFYLMKNIINSLKKEKIFEVLDLNIGHYTPEQFNELFSIYDYKINGFTFKETNLIFELRYTYKSMNIDEVFKKLDTIGIESDGYGKHNIAYLGQDFFKYYLIDNYDERILPFFYDSKIYINGLIDILPKKMVTRDFLLNANIEYGEKYTNVYDIVATNNIIGEKTLKKCHELLFKQLKHLKTPLKIKRLIYDLLKKHMKSYYGSSLSRMFIILDKKNKIKKIKKYNFKYNDDDNTVEALIRVYAKYDIRNNKIYRIENEVSYNTLEDAIKHYKGVAHRYSGQTTINIPLSSVTNVNENEIKFDLKYLDKK